MNQKNLFHMKTFQEKIVYLFSQFLHDRLTYNEKESLGYIIESLCNIDTQAKEKVFHDLVSCYPKYDYENFIKSHDSSNKFDFKFYKQTGIKFY